MDEIRRPTVSFLIFLAMLFSSEQFSLDKGFRTSRWDTQVGRPDFDRHGKSARLSTGQRAILAGVQGITTANGGWPITVTHATHFTLNGSGGNGNYVGGTGTCPAASHYV